MRGRHPLALALSGVLAVAACSSPLTLSPSPDPATSPRIPSPSSLRSPTETVGLPTLSAAPTPSLGTPDTSAILPIGSPKPGDEQTAHELLKKLQGALTSQDWKSAWDLLGPETQNEWHYSDFATSEYGFMQSAGAAYDVTEFTHDPARIRFFVIPDNYPTNPITIQTANFDRSFVAQVWYRALRDNNAGWNEYLLGPDQSGIWRVWWLR